MSLDHYIKSGVIGKGSYGEVWKVKHKKDRKQYVLKKLDLHNASKRERKAAEQEAKLLSRLKHPNIVSYKDSFEGGDGFLYIAMGYCEGGDLYARLKEQKGQPLEEKQIVEWFVQIAMALQYMHERNILHRDLKTQNIFLTKSKIIKVGDLGIAKVLDSSSDMATTLIGTPYYMSPELFSNKPYNHKSDVWALGCCVYEMATLKHAFNAKDMNSLVYKILRGKSPPMPKHYSDELLALIKAMMNHNTDKRPSVNRVLRDPFIKKNIAVFLEGTKKNRRPSSAGNRPGSSESRRPRTGSAEEDQDGSESVRSVASNVSNVSSVAGLNREYSRQKAQPVEEKLEALHDGPDLEPIREEQTPRDLLDGAEVKRSRQVNRPAAQPREPPVFQAPLVGEVAQAGIRKKKRRFLAEAAQQNHQVQQKPVLINIESRKSPVPVERPLKPSNESAFLKPRQTDALNVNSKPPRAESPNDNHGHHSPVRQRNLSPKSRSDSSPVGCSSGAQSPSERAGSRSPRNKSSAVNRSNSPKSSSGGSSSGSGGSSVRKKSSVGNPQRVAKPRPLPAKPRSAEPPAESAEPQKSKSSRGSARDRESGYGSSSSATNSRNEDIPEVTPRGSINKSARERRREQKERETPRTARSVDITPRPFYSEPASRPVTADNNRRPETRSPKNDLSLDEVDQKVHKSSSYPSCQERQLPSSVAGKPGGSKSHHIRQPSLGGDEESSSSNEGEENESEEIVKKKESKRNDKDMKNFISLLDTTLRMNKEEDKSDSDDDDDIVTPDKLAPPGSTTYIKRGKKKGAREVGAGGDAPMIASPEPEEEKRGLENKNPLSPDLNIQEYLELYPGGSPSGAAGKTMTTTGRLWERITMLRKDCIRGLGVEKLKGAYDILDQFEADDLEPQLVSLLGKEEFDEYAGKIWQLKFCEEAAFGLI